MFGAFIVHPRDPPPNYGVEVAGEFSMISGKIEVIYYTKYAYMSAVCPYIHCMKSVSET